MKLDSLKLVIMCALHEAVLCELVAKLDAEDFGSVAIRLHHWIEHWISCNTDTPVERAEMERRAGEGLAALLGKSEAGPSVNNERAS